MSRSKWVAMLMVAAFAVVPVLAGHDYEKCEYSTQECLDMMANKMKTSSYVGVELDRDEATGFYVITAVVDDSPASAAGLMQGDLIFAVNGIKGTDDEGEAMWTTHKKVKPGENATWSVKRNGAPIDIELTLAPMPADVLAKWIGQHMIQHATVEVAEN